MARHDPEQVGDSGRRRDSADREREKVPASRSMTASLKAGPCASHLPGPAVRFAATCPVPFEFRISRIPGRSSSATGSRHFPKAIPVADRRFWMSGSGALLEAGPRQPVPGLWEAEKVLDCGQRIGELVADSPRTVGTSSGR